MENGFDPKLPISTQIAVMHNTASMWTCPMNEPMHTAPTRN